MSNIYKAYKGKEHIKPGMVYMPYVPAIILRDENNILKIKDWIRSKKQAILFKDSISSYIGKDNSIDAEKLLCDLLTDEIDKAIKE